MALSTWGRGEDTLARYYTISESGDKLKSKYWENSYSGEGKRVNLRRHLRTCHSDIYSEEYQLTSEDMELKQDMELLGIPMDGNMQFRKYVCFQFNGTSKRPDFAYTVLSRRIWGKKEIIVRGKQHNVCMDKFLEDKNQLNKTDFKGSAVPENYHMGHYLARDFFRWSKEHYLRVDLFSLVGIQHRQLNLGHWKCLEESAFGMTLHYKVRVLNGTVGKLNLPKTSRAEIPRFWYYIILTSDLDNTNWRYSAHIFPNISCDAPLADYKVTIDDVIAFTGLNFFKNIVSEMTSLNACSPLTKPVCDSLEKKWFLSTKENVEPPKKKMKKEKKLRL